MRTQLSEAAIANVNLQWKQSNNSSSTAREGIGQPRVGRKVLQALKLPFKMALD
jgi:hypothetical protein